MTDHQLFPHFICRVAGVPVGGLEDLAAVESVASYRALQELEAELGKLRGPLNEALFEAVGGLEDPELRRALLRLKRDVHNLRPPDCSDLEKVRSLVPDLERYDRLTGSLRQAEARFEACFEAELIRIRRRFQEAVTDEGFRNGVLLASTTLFDEIERYTRAEAGHPGAKARQVERSLLRYYTRTAVKTTPFSTFCAVIPGRISGRLRDDPSPGIGATFAGSAAHPRPSSPRPSSPAPSQPPSPGEEGAPTQQQERFGQVPLSRGGGWGGRERGRGEGLGRGRSEVAKSVVRLNKAMVPFLVQALTARPAVRRHLSVELNPTLRQKDGRWLFLTGLGRREVFQHLAPNPVLDLLLDVLRDRDPLPLAVLTETLREDVEASEEEIAAYLDRLLDAGFLRFRLGIREQELDWDRCLCGLLANIEDNVEDDLARRTVDFLREYRRLTDAYAEAALERRRALLERVTALVEGYFARVEETEGWLPGTETLFEDAAGKESFVLDLGGLGDLLAEYVGLIRPFIWLLGEQANMRHFFNRHYGADPVPLLQFYEDYYREHLAGHVERQKQFWGREADDGETLARLDNPFRLEVVEKLNAARQGLEKRIRELWRAAPSAEEIVLQRRDLEELTAALPDLEEPFRSISLFVQPMPDGVVLEEVLNGFGKYFSRFLYLLPEEVEKDLVASNRRLTRSALAEICGDASFNADLHPPLLPEEIAYPTAEGGSAREQISVRDLAVEPDPRCPFRVRLVDTATGRQVVPIDLGFRNPRMRPLLFQMLSRMTPASAFVLNVPSRPEEPEKPEGTGRESPGHVVHRPRLTYRGRLVLARRRWTLPQALFPSRDRRESEAGYFLRIQRWREELGLPEEVFVRIVDLTGGPWTLPETMWPGQLPPGRTPPGKRPGLRDHLAKPQYVDFRNPLLVDLFSRMTENLETFQVILEERLPGRDQLVPWGEERFVTEMILQLDFPEREATSSREEA
ncbi:MAG TPA: lantibiotic dehydratase [Thermoanaerobaculia bacterium]|nr:lantibiotic dehydratase [Thermoanaerobaculia bacterium]